MVQSSPSQLIQFTFHPYDRSNLYSHVVLQVYVTAMIDITYFNYGGLDGYTCADWIDHEDEDEINHDGIDHEL